VAKRVSDDKVADKKVTDAQVTDELPQDLDVTALDGDYTIPNNSRRRIPATMYLVLGLAAVLAAVAWSDTSPFVNHGLWVAGGLLALFGVYGLAAGRTLLVDETDALVAATAQVGFPVGHASAQMVWRGWWSKPVWRLLLYSNENPPARRGLVVVDGFDGSVIEWFTEENPETWESE